MALSHVSQVLRLSLSLTSSATFANRLSSGRILFARTTLPGFNNCDGVLLNFRGQTQSQKQCSNSVSSSKKSVILANSLPALPESYPQIRYSSHPGHPSLPFIDISNAAAAKSFIIHLDDHSRTLLHDELTKLRSKAEKDEDENAYVPVSRAQLWNVVLFHGFPFIGFGLLDNMIMIIAGEYIDATLGAMLSISTMAAAALGNLISDLAGVGTAGYVELLASKVGVNPPNLTPVQALSKPVMWSVALGRSVGITIGCIIGMFPLLFFNKDDDDEDEEDQKTETKPSE